MINMIRYEEMAVKAVLSLVIAIAVVLCGLMILGIELMTCNPLILVGGISVMAFFIWFMSVLKL